MPHVVHIPIGRNPANGLPMVGPQALAQAGFNMLVEVATASVFVNNKMNPQPRKSITLMAHLDTGASMTTISTVVAQHLGLIPVGAATSQTANGTASNPTYAIDLLFAAARLLPRINMGVGSCTLPFTLAAHAVSQADPKNFGLLIGRDLMASWHMTWHGPTSTIFIAE